MREPNYFYRILLMQPSSPQKILVKKPVCGTVIARDFVERIART